MKHLFMLFLFVGVASGQTHWWKDQMKKDAVFVDTAGNYQDSCDLAEMRGVLRMVQSKNLKHPRRWNVVGGGKISSPDSQYGYMLPPQPFEDYFPDRFTQTLISLWDEYAKWCADSVWKKTGFLQYLPISKEDSTSRNGTFQLWYALRTVPDTIKTVRENPTFPSFIKFLKRKEK